MARPCHSRPTSVYRQPCLPQSSACVSCQRCRAKKRNGVPTGVSPPQALAVSPLQALAVSPPQALARSCLEGWGEQNSFKGSQRFGGRCYRTCAAAFRLVSQARVSRSSSEDLCRAQLTALAHIPTSNAKDKLMYASINFFLRQKAEDFLPEKPFEQTITSGRAPQN